MAVTESASVLAAGSRGNGHRQRFVPSASALIVSLSSVALGRTAFGVVLVVGYDQRMAVTLTVAGLLPVGIRDRHAQRQIAGTGRTGWLAKR